MDDFQCYIAAITSKPALGALLEHFAEKSNEELELLLQSKDLLDAYLHQAERIKSRTL